jgi:hypothetical protein
MKGMLTRNNLAGPLASGSEPSAQHSDCRKSSLRSERGWTRAPFRSGRGKSRSRRGGNWIP